MTYYDTGLSGGGVIIAAGPSQENIMNEDLIIFRKFIVLIRKWFEKKASLINHPAVIKDIYAEAVKTVLTEEYKIPVSSVTTTVNRKKAVKHPTVKVTLKTGKAGT